MPISWIKPTWEHAASRFMCVTLEVIDILQTNFLNWVNLDNEIPGIDGENAAVIVAESLEADRVWNLLPNQLLNEINHGPESDFKTACVAELFFAADQEDQLPNRRQSNINYREMAMASLEKIALSSTASPLLWYEEIYDELAYSVRSHSSEKALDWLKRCLAHNLHYHDGNNGVPALRDIADVYLEKGELDDGLVILTNLFHQEPDDIWTYNFAAITFNQFGLPRLGLQATQRGLDLLNAKGDPEELRPQLEECLQNMKAYQGPDREGDIKPQVKEAFQSALKLDFDFGERGPIDDLCHKLIPDLSGIFVKTHLDSTQIPLPVREMILEQLASGTTAIPTKKTRHRRKKRYRSQ